MTFGLVGFLEVWAVGKIVFGVSIPFEHPGALALTLLVTVFAMAGTAVAFASVFVLTRNPFTFTNSASFPFYVLGGVFVPDRDPAGLDPAGRRRGSSCLERRPAPREPEAGARAQRVGAPRHGRAARRGQLPHRQSRSIVSCFGACAAAGSSSTA